jgi:putative FmdB family regulatory protein
MPLYDYVCTSCGHQIEVMHSVHGHGPSACPVCGSPMKKAYAPPAVHFKGSGWARKEHSSKPAKPAEKSGSSEGSAAGDPSASKTTKDD